MNTKIVTKVWQFSSSSNPNKFYETLQYTDGSTSCNCPGWTRRAIRTCKHTRLVDMGQADDQCVACHNYATDIKHAKLTPPTAKHIEVEVVPKKKKKSDIPTVRKIQWK